MGRAGTWGWGAGSGLYVPVGLDAWQYVNSHGGNGHLWRVYHTLMQYTPVILDAGHHGQRRGQRLVHTVHGARALHQHAAVVDAGEAKALAGSGRHRATPQGHHHLHRQARPQQLRLHAPARTRTT